MLLVQKSCAELRLNFRALAASSYKKGCAGDVFSVKTLESQGLKKKKIIKISQLNRNQKAHVSIFYTTHYKNMV